MFCPILEKQTIIDTIERSSFQLLKTLKKNNSKPESYKSTKKIHATMLEKKFVLLP